MSDRELGMDRDITRRDFLDGASLAIGGAVAASAIGGREAAAATARSQGSPDYPPGLTGLRGQNDAALQYAHALRDGSGVGQPENTGEIYDLVIVGAGMSGLGAAYFHRKHQPNAKILIRQSR